MARSRYSVKITEEIINTARARDSSHCVIADALRASIPGATRVSVDLQTIRWSVDELGKRFVALTPGAGQRILVNFDQGVLPEPTTLQVTPFQVIPIRPTGPGPRTVTDARTNGRGGAQAGSTALKSKPLVEGGKLPPTAALSNRKGRRREFGLRQLDR